MKALIIFAAVVGYTLNLLAIFYGVYDAFADNLTITQYIKFAGVTALRIAGVFFLPLGAVLGYF